MPGETLSATLHVSDKASQRRAAPAIAANSRSYKWPVHPEPVEEVLRDFRTASGLRTNGYLRNHSVGWALPTKAPRTSERSTPLSGKRYLQNCLPIFHGR